MNKVQLIEWDGQKGNLLGEMNEDDFQSVREQIRTLMLTEEGTGRSKRVFAYQILPSHAAWAKKHKVEEFTEVEKRDFKNGMAASERMGYKTNSISLAIAAAKRADPNEVEAEVGGIIWRYLEDMPD